MESQPSAAPAKSGKGILPVAVIFGILGFGAGFLASDLIGVASAPTVDQTYTPSTTTSELGSELEDAADNAADAAEDVVDDLEDAARDAIDETEDAIDDLPAPDSP